MEAETDFPGQTTSLTAKQLRDFLADKTMKAGPEGDVRTDSASCVSSVFLTFKSLEHTMIVFP